jgi:DivIVA domain-containing protein
MMSGVISMGYGIIAVIFPSLQNLGWVVVVCVTLGLYLLDTAVVTIWNSFIGKKLRGFYWSRKVPPPEPQPPIAEPTRIDVAVPRFNLGREELFYSGYFRKDVESFVFQVASMPDTPAGRQVLCELVNDTQFPLVYEGGYDIDEVDEYVDQLRAELMR